MTTLAKIAASVAAAIGNANNAADAASVVKFDGLVTFAATVALRVRKEDVDGGSNLETDGKGRLVAVVDKSKDQRTALVADLVKAGVGDKDAANIASMGRSLAMFVVPLMVDDGSLRDAVSGERMRQIIEETVLYLTHGKDTYNALEKLRGNKWAMLPIAAPVVEADATDTDTGPVDHDMDATLDTVTDGDASGEAASETDPEATLNSEVSNAVRVLTAALERGDVERIAAMGGGTLAASLVPALTAWNAARDAERAEAEAQALEAKAAKARKQA